MKKSLKKVVTGAAVLLSLASLSACGSSASSGSSDSSGNAATEITDSDDALKIWTTSNALKESAETWSEESGKEVEVVVIPYADFQTKLKQQVSDASTAPDVFIVARDFVKEWTEKDSVIVNLSATFPEDVATYEDQTYDELVTLGSTEDGQLMATTGEYPVGMMFYNRVIAKEILGTDDPEAVAEALSTTDKWLEVNQKLQDTYGSDTKLVGTVTDTINMLGQQRENPYVVDDVFTIDSTISGLFDQGEVLYENKMFLAEDENEAVQAGYNSDSFFVNFLPSWGFSSKIKPQIDGNTNAGNWGVTSPTYSYSRGGSYFFMTKTSENMKSAWEYIKSQTVDNDNLVADQQSKVGFPSSKTAAETLVSSGLEEPLLGNEKVYDYYQAAADVQEANTKDIVTKYDGTIVKFINDLIKDVGAGNITKEDALKQLGDSVKTAYPELTVEMDY